MKCQMIIAAFIIPLLLVASACNLHVAGSSTTCNTPAATCNTPTATFYTPTAALSTPKSLSPSAELISRAEHMLSEHGATITDAKGDWVWTGLPEDNPTPYPVPWADLLSATFAVDADYLYIRLTVAGVYPRSEAELPWYGDDQVNKPGVNIALDTDNNKYTGCLPDKGAEVTIGVGMMTQPIGGWKDVYNFWYEPTGIEFPEMRRYVHTENQDLVVAAWGGAGFNYRVFILPAGLLGLHPGQTIAVIGWDESPSLKYPDRHATLDILGQGDMDNRIVIQLPK